MNNYKPSDYSTQLKCYNEGEYSLIELFNPTTNESLCKINVVDGKLSFSGNLDESAQRFMELVRSIYNSYKPYNKVIAEFKNVFTEQSTLYRVEPDRDCDNLYWMIGQEVAFDGAVRKVVGADIKGNYWYIYAE